MKLLPFATKTTIAMLVALSLGNAQAGTVTAFSNQSGMGVLQDYGHALGLDFRVNAPILITGLGAFDNGVVQNLAGKDGSGVTVGIFDVSTGMQIGQSVLFTPGSASNQVGGDAFLQVSPFLLGIGTYSVVAANDMNYNTGGGVNATSTTNTGGDLISLIGGGRFTTGTSNALAFPTTIDGGPTNRYGAGTFQFTAAVPEPESMLLLAVGAVGLVVARRRRS